MSRTSTRGPGASRLLGLAFCVAALLTGCLETDIFPVDTSTDIAPPPGSDFEPAPDETIPDGTGAAGAVTITIVDPSPWHVHAPGTPFEIQVTASGPGIESAYVVAQWVDSEGQPLDGAKVLLAGETRTLSSPGGTVGYYGLVFTGATSEVSFPPQTAGNPSMEYGFAIMEPADTGREADPESYFGTIHCRIEVDEEWDPYLRGHHAKTMSWLSSSPTWWNYEIERRTRMGMTELPIVSGDAWETDNDTPVSTADLDAFEAKFAGLANVSPDGLNWELGREENRNDRYETAFYMSNLLEKAKRANSVLANLAAPGRLVYQFEGFDSAELETLLTSDAIKEFDILSLHPYKWTTFPDPEGWLPEWIDTVKTMLADNGLDMELWITETGIPVRGTTDPDAFFGYPSSGSGLPGATRDYAAKYLVKLNVLAISNGIKRVYQYNYQNRGNDIDYAEHHFGLRSYNPVKRAPGYPLPGYVSCTTMMNLLYQNRFTEAREPKQDARVYEFSEPGTNEVTIVAWATPDNEVTLTWSELRAGLAAGDVVSVKDVYGTGQSVDAAGVTLDDSPRWITIRIP
jgi:hypothetical protein